MSTSTHSDDTVDVKSEPEWSTDRKKNHQQMTVSGQTSSTAHGDQLSHNYHNSIILLLIFFLSINDDAF